MPVMSHGLPADSRDYVVNTIKPTLQDFVTSLRPNNLDAKAGNGGAGVVRWRHEKSKEFSGPGGGNGGQGGDVYVRGVRDYGILSKYRTIKDFTAEDGERGRGKSEWGKNGKDLVLDVPVGSILTKEGTGETFEVLHEGELVFLLKGGQGGYGNEHFKASTNVAPIETTPGKPGEEATFHLELRLIVDLGFAGFPNAGKSSLLNAITNAHAKVANYKFTTLEPNLGDLFGFILADIPGLIEGASEGKGLGYQFLRHIARTKGILHCVSLENENITEAYHAIRKELEAFSPELAKKEEILLLTKTDMITPDILKEKIKEAKKLNKNIMTVSVYDLDSIKKLQDELVKYLRAKVSEKELHDRQEGSIEVRFEALQAAPTKHLEERIERQVKKIRSRKKK